MLDFSSWEYNDLYQLFETINPKPLPVEKRRKEDKSSEKKPSITQENSEETLSSVTENSTNKNKPGKKPRFILFVGECVIQS